MMVMSRLSFTVVLLLLLLVTTQSNASTTSAKKESKFPDVAIIIIVLVGIFFTIGCVSVFMQSCLASALGINDRRSPGNWLNVRQTRSGLDETVIETFPTFCYSNVKALRIGEELLECPVCLNAFEDDETLRLIPQCFHVFHPACIDAWLRSHTTCPLCRSNLIPVPGESVPFEIPGLAREPCQGSPGTLIDDNRRRVWGSPDDDRLFDSVTWTGNQSMPRKSMSTGCKLDGLFSQSSSTTQLGENLDRFTLRLPQEIHDRLMNKGSKDNVALPQARSSTRGYRIESLGTERNYFYFERFDKNGRLDRRPFSITPPFRTDSMRSPDGVIQDDGIYQEGSGPPKAKGLLLAISSSFDWLFTEKNNDGERSYLRSSDASPV